jgi:hypothetical protein
MVCGPDLQAVLQQMSLHAARQAVGLVPFHAAALSTPVGVIAIAGPSGTGKSTLCAIGVQAGYGYVADEVTAVDPDDLAVRPFHRPIGLRRGAADALGIEHRLGHPDCTATVHPWNPPEDQHSAGGALCGVVMVSRSSPGPIDDVTPPAAMAALLQHTVIPDDQLEPAFHGLSSIVRRVPVVRATYDTPADGRVLLADLVARWG